MEEAGAPDMEGAIEIVSWFGRWPSFHDAEVLQLHLDRTAKSYLHIHAWNMTDRVNDTGVFETEKHAVVTFTLEHVSDLELSDFSTQNVIAGLDIEREGEAYRVILYPCYGIAGRIDAGKVSVSLTPGKPSEGKNVFGSE